MTMPDRPRRSSVFGRPFWLLAVIFFGLFAALNLIVVILGPSHGESAGRLLVDVLRVVLFAGMAAIAWRRYAASLDHQPN